MKKPLLTGIAALLLATGAAHAAEEQLFECGDVTVNREYISNASVYNIQIVIPRHEKKRKKPPVVVFDMSHANLKLKVDGKACKEDVHDKP